jgi:hypothetical protein
MSYLCTPCDAVCWEGKTVQHFSSTEWADFVRGVTSPSDRQPLQEHLESGCADCRASVEDWEAIVDFARQERLNEPPESTLRIVGAYLNMARFSPRRSIEVASLAFDSLQSRLVGERGSTSASRQLLFKCGTLCVDVRLEPKPGSDYIVMVGQVIDSRKPLKGFGDLPVSLLSHGDKVSETTTNRFGEFHFGFHSTEQVQLLFGIQQKGMIVPLPQGYAECAV